MDLQEIETSRGGGAGRYDTEYRHLLTHADDGPAGPWQELTALWFASGGEIGEMPSYSAFDILNLPPALWPHVCLTKLIGAPKRIFHVATIGSAIETHNGFFGNNRPMRELPLKNREVMRREFCWVVRHGGPVFSSGPYIGAVDYIRQVRRLITPYRISRREYAFVFYAEFEPYPEKRKYL
ncbi:MAG: hypothetical protein NXI18_00045 [Alphaproteobacteria bacterium]|nr:hypothetical protein [Alphaproteobacteria bacterium]